MPADELHFSSNFKNIITYFKVNEPFLESGNLNADILIIGKETTIDNKDFTNTIYFY